MKPYWLLPSCLSVLVCAMPAYAGRITSWRFDTVQNRLFFTTDAGVQPRAQLLSNPTRLVVDLPGTELGRPTVRQQFRGIFSSLRIGQADNQTTRIVLELLPGYGLNPQGIIFRGASPVQWSVQLPNPQRVAPAPSFPRSQGNPPGNFPPVEPPSDEPQTSISVPRLVAQADGRIPSADESQAIVPTTIAQAGGIQIQNFQVTRGGFFLRSFGGSPVINLSRSRDRDTILIDIENATFSSNLLGRQFNIDRYGVEQVEFTAIESSPRLARVTLRVNPKSPNWRAFFSRLGGIVLLPQGQILSDLPNRPIQSTRPTRPLFSNPPTINSSSPPPTFNSGAISIPVPPPERNSTPIFRQPTTPSTTQLPPVRNGRVTVLIDPGHGGYDSGAPGVGGVLEKHIVLSISRKVNAILRQNGIQSVMTRTGDYFVELSGRTQMVPRVGADVFVSIHANAIGGRPDVKGLEVYYFGPAGERLARTIHRSIVNNVTIPDRGVRKARFYVLRKNSVPATLVEVGFVTSPSESAKLTSDAYQDEMARAIAQGIIQFVRQNF
ncbi:N-acetylmuramoyl-L-alanine amidase [Merismopedia glauca]|uniref:N-acetylmuramoyl-L-alanine amidase n=1 Tax=Merismopedia glauca CCAP 1448/3 TaxID=1296344 RepID=A0A2T1C653_9CYAN|nr:N-acetylmuramoyl-L-alanine amidase [Merismopedia glauca]PSB03741.1 N-acetylmuramoyl-L-alanine amidase [Merismopedia glauca CCAP 1448/3]